MFRSLVLGVVGMATGYGLVGLVQQPAGTQPPPAANQGEPAPRFLDVRQLPVERIPVGTVIGQHPPQGWSHLVLFATPTLTPEDLRDAPRMATHYARMFKFTLLANVAGQRNGSKAAYYLERIARGFAIDIRGKETIVSGSNTLGANLGLFGKRILDENERILDNDVRQVARTSTMLIFDAQAVMLRNNAHMRMIARHALLVEPETGQLSTLVWLLDKDYQAAEGVIQSLPNGMREQRLLSVKKELFLLGIPGPEAFALRRLPPGTPISYDRQLQWAATQRTFTAENVPHIETILRNAVRRAAAPR